MFLKNFRSLPDKDSDTIKDELDYIKNLSFPITIITINSNFRNFPPLFVEHYLHPAKLTKDQSRKKIAKHILEKNEVITRQLNFEEEIQSDELSISVNEEISIELSDSEGELSDYDKPQENKCKKVLQSPT